jgi:tRNA (mo5U34)-methyltransferase
VSVIHKAARIFADEGFTGLVRRTARKALGGKPKWKPEPAPDATAAQIAAAKADYERQEAAFRLRCRELGHTGLDHHYWYHAVDLGSGLVTPGDYDFRGQIGSFGFPADMTGMRVLDVGSATGFFAFEFERRGADVVSVELPSLAAWDMVSAEREDMLRRLMEAHGARSPEEAYDRHLAGPFRFCQTALGSRVRRCYSSIYDLTLEKVGGEKFDLVYAGDILMHLFSPFKALDVLSGLTRGSLVATIEVPFPGPADQPLIAFRGLINGEEGRTWWMPSRGCVEQMLRRLGFTTVELAGRYSGIARRAWFPYEREVIRATLG